MCNLEIICKQNQIKLSAAWYWVCVPNSLSSHWYLLAALQKWVHHHLSELPPHLNLVNGKQESHTRLFCLAQ